MSKSTSLLLTCLCSLLASRECFAYTFTKIADTSTPAPQDQFYQFDFPAISGGTVAFDANYGILHDGKGIFTGTGGPLTAIAKLHDPISSGGIITSFVTGPTISDGTVAFIADTTAATQFRAIFTGSGGPLATLAYAGEVSPIGKIFIGPQPVIDHGTIVFEADTIPSGPSIFTSNGGPLTPILKLGDSGPLGVISAFSGSTISGDHIAFIGQGGPTLNAAIYEKHSNTISVIAKAGDVTPSGTISNLGLSSPLSVSGDNVSFVAELDSFRTGVFIGNGGPLTQVAVTGTPGEFQFLDYPSVVGTKVAFTGSLYPPIGPLVSGVYLYDNGSLTKVIATGDKLFGRAVTGVSVGSFGSTQMAAVELPSAMRDDSSRGIAIANPVGEPASLSLAAVCVGVFGIRARRK